AWMILQQDHSNAPTSPARSTIRPRFCPSRHREVPGGLVGDLATNVCVRELLAYEFVEHR
ncbi:MAG: hypothetical protein AAF497_15095, partial [Planctomycetota bacterium]